VRGLFLTLEGADGTGKDTQVRLLAEALEKRGRRVCVTREPGGTRLGNVIRRLLLNPANRDMTARTELLLYLASRAQHVEELIHPALARGEDVVCSRFSDSTLAYQCGGLGLAWAEVEALDRFATGGLVPDMTFVFDLPPEEARQRLGEAWQRRDRLTGQIAFVFDLPPEEARQQSRRREQNHGAHGPDRIEERPLDYYDRVRQAFLDLAAQHPDRIHVVDARPAEEEVHAAVMAILDPLLRTDDERKQFPR
jgi:dTMP kinase